MKRVLWVVTVFIITGCAHHASTKTVHQTQAVRKLPAFNRLEIQGPVDVRLYTGSKESKVVLRGASKDLAKVKTSVNKSMLKIKMASWYNRPIKVQVDVFTRYVNQIKTKNSGQLLARNLQSGLLDLEVNNSTYTFINGKVGLRHVKVNGKSLVDVAGVSTRDLDVSLSGKARMNLTGRGDLKHLAVSGEGVFGMYWVDSETFKLRARNHAVILLAGVVNLLDAELWDNACLKARYLRVRRSFVKTHDHAIARITTEKKQHGLADGRSDIYFYTIPDMRADFMGESGAILDLREWSQYGLRDYKPYNKHAAS